MTTKGEYRVGVNFNPSADGTVDKIKRAAADLIDLIEGIANASDNPEVPRLKALAQTQIEDGAMWAVKAATKPDAPAGYTLPQAAAGAEGDDLFVAVIRTVLKNDDLADLRTKAKPLIDRIVEALRKEGFVAVSEEEVRNTVSEIRAGKI